MATLYERMKAAWATNDPGALDREAENMARYGVAETEIYAALEELLLKLREAGLEEEADDRINDVMDRLTGWCHHSCHIRTVRNTLPSEEEIAKLPRWARVAFAARCARRVLPLCELDARVHLGSQLGVLTDCVRSAESKAGDAGESRAADREMPRLLVLEGITAATITSAVVSSVKAAIVEASGRGGAAPAASYAVLAFENGDLRPVIRRDFDHLSRLAEWQHWTDDTPVPPEVFGPLWPEGPPKSWPPVTDIPQRADLAIEAFARGQATEQMIEDDIVNLFNALNRYHIARSGVRLTLEQFRSLLPAFVPAEV